MDKVSINLPMVINKSEVSRMVNMMDKERVNRLILSLRLMLLHQESPERIFHFENINVDYFNLII